MIKSTKEERRTFFMYYGWTIPVFLVVFWVTFYFVFNQIYAVKPFEQLTFFYAAYGLKDNSFHEKMRKELEPQPCYEVNYYDYSLNDKTIYSKYSAVRDNCDFFVFSEYDLTEIAETAENIFMPIDGDMISRINLPAHYTFYEYNSVTYGIKLFDKDDETYNEQTKFKDYINFTYEDKKDSFYLVINKKSANFSVESNHILGYLGMEYLFNHVGA